MSSEDGWGGEHLTWTRTWSPTQTLPATPSSSAGPPAPAVAPPAPPCCPTHRGLHFRGSPALLLAAGWGVVVVVGSAGQRLQPSCPPGPCRPPHTPGPCRRLLPLTLVTPGPLSALRGDSSLDVGSLLPPGHPVSHVLRGFPGGHGLWGAQERGSQLLLENRHLPGDPPSGPGRVVPPALSSPQAQVRVLVSQESPGQGRLRQPVVATTRTLSGQVQPGSMSPPRGPGLRSSQGGLAPLLPAGPGALTWPHRPEPPPKAGYTVAFLRARGSAAPRMSSPSPVQLPRGTSLCW